MGREMASISYFVFVLLHRWMLFCIVEYNRGIEWMCHPAVDLVRRCKLQR